MDEIKWIQRYFDLACHVATWSKDPTTKVGAIVVGRNRRDIALGYNGFPPGVVDTPERYADRPTKYVFTQHAERAVLDNARFDLQGATLITTMFPCVECAKSIAAKGIVHLVTPKMPKPLPGEPSWRDLLLHSLTILKECDIQVTFVDLLTKE